MRTPVVALALALLGTAISVEVRAAPSPAPAPAPPVEDRFLDRFLGTWTGSRRVQERDATATLQLQFAWDIDHQFLRMDYVSVEQSGTQQSRFQGRGYFRAYEGYYYGTWIDNTGAMTSFTGYVDGDALVLDWWYGARTTYRLSGGSLLVVASQQGQDGTYAETSRVTYGPRR